MNKKNNEDIVKSVFKDRYPKFRGEFSFINNNTLVKYYSNTDTKFIQFFMKSGYINGIQTNNKHLPEVKNLLSLNKMKRSSLNIINDALNMINVNKHFNFLFDIEYTFKINEPFSFIKGGSDFSLSSATKRTNYYQCKIHKSYYTYKIYNYFKIKKDGQILPVPVLTFLDNNKHGMTLAFNLYEETIHLIKNDDFYFEDFFSSNDIFDPEYDVDCFVDSFIDKNILTSLDNDNPIRQELILLPRNYLSDKVNLLGMYLI